MDSALRLPTLRTGINHLHTDADGAVPSLAINQTLLFGGTGAWVDSCGTCDTQTISQLAPTDAILDRITVTRAFTAHQHVSLIEGLTDRLDSSTAIFVVPNLDHFYVADDLQHGEPDTLVRTVLDRLAREAQRYDVPVLVTTRTDRFDHLLAEYVDHDIRCEQTSQGVRFRTENFDTLAYQGPGYIQTTLLFWERVLEETYERIEKEVIQHRAN